MLFLKDLCNNCRSIERVRGRRFSQLGMLDDNTIAKSEDERTLFREVTGDK